MLKHNGFTLIEVLIVVAIVGILASVVIPSYQEFVLETKRTDGKAALLDMGDRQERYYSQNNTYASSTALLYGAAGTQLSPKEFYVLTINSGDTNAFLITATAQAEQTDDTACITMTYNQAGAKTPEACWE
ncbi:MAG: hypothetical protein DIZ80_09890 [endosymbiont of Galathealinum brachiosum]|uniref:Pilus assembly protein PilE n=1 Tax=endosymbiont of Galathealinum brachiosum TaxID=2200906 RepID=A0A370DEJ6_9GAMM|nr:MAG: hypothetical protein DIZ80_09890 [endosymbiont of Galathealinum brachiosum]